MAELERSLIAERVRAGLRNARAKGKILGRRPVLVDREKVAALRAQGLSWQKVANKLRLSEPVVRRAMKNHSPNSGASPEMASTGP